jgi:hypothetical protein
MLFGFLLVALLVPVTAHGYIGTYSRWMNDNYCTAQMATALGFWPAQRFWYFNWTGRFAYTLVDSAAGVVGPWAAAPQAPLALILWFGLLAVLMHQLRLVTTRPTGVWVSLSLAALVLFLTLDNAPLLAQSLYWTNALHNYVAPLITGTALALVVLIASQRAAQARERWAWLTACFALAWFGSGFTEIYGIMQLGILVAALCLGWLAGSPPWRRVGLPLVAAAVAGAGVGLIIVLTAPGNATRQTGYAPPGSLADIVRLTYAITYTFLVGTVKSFGLKLAGAAAISGLAGFALGEETAVGLGSPRQVLRALLWLPAATVGVLTVGFAAVAYATSAFPIARAGIVPHYLFAWLIVVCGYAAGRATRAAGLWDWVGRERVVWQAALGLCLAGLVVSTGLSTARTLKTLPDFRNFATQWDRAHAELKAARTAGVTLVTLPRLPNVYQLDELSADPNAYLNRCMGDYYGTSIRVVD